MHESLIDVIDYFGINLVLMHARWQAVAEDGVVSVGDLKSKSPRQAVRDRLSDTLSKFNAHESPSRNHIGHAARAVQGRRHSLARKSLYKLDIDERPLLMTYLHENSSAQQIFE